MKRLQRFQALFLFFTVKLPSVKIRLGVAIGRYCWYNRTVIYLEYYTGKRQKGEIHNGL